MKERQGLSQEFTKAGLIRPMISETKIKASKQKVLKKFRFRCRQMRVRERIQKTGTKLWWKRKINDDSG